MVISAFTRSKIITLHRFTNKSKHEIAKIAGVDRHSVRRILKEGEGDRKQNLNKRGPKPKLDQEKFEMLLSHSLEHPDKTSIDLRNYLAEKGILVDPSTVRRRLNQIGRKARRPRKKQLLTQRMKDQRLDWANVYKHWTKEDWKRVLFTDETQFYCQGQRSQWVRRTKGEKISEKHISQFAKFPQKMMFWGSFSYQGVGSLRPVEGIMDANKYIKVIQETITKDMSDAFSTDRGKLQQDLAPCHRAKKVLTEFSKHNIELLYWPGNSPDLNPIENLWAIVKDEQKKRDSGTKDKLKDVVIDVWFNNPKISEYCKVLVESMPNRIQELIHNNGGHINY